MYITESNQYAIELVTYLLVLVVYFYEFIVYMFLERNAFDSIAFFSQCRLTSVGFLREPMNIYNRKPLTLKFSWVLHNFFDLYHVSINFTSFSILNWNLYFISCSTIHWEKILLNQKHFFPKACISWIQINML